jgi:hypothetical protein
MSASVERGAFQEHTVQIRFDDKPARSERWNESTDNEALFSPNPTQFARSVATAKRLRLGFTPFNPSPVIIEFSVDAFGEPMKEIANVCRWPQTTP